MRKFVEAFLVVSKKFERGAFLAKKEEEKKIEKEEEVVLDVFSLVALTSGLQLVE